MNMTPKQLALARAIRDYRLAHGYSPSLRELGDALGVCSVTVHQHVDALVRKGVLVRNPNKARSLEVSPDVALPGELDSELAALCEAHGADVVRARLDSMKGKHQ